MRIRVRPSVSSVTRSRQRSRRARSSVLGLAFALLVAASATWMFGRDPGPIKTTTTATQNPKTHQKITTVERAEPTVRWTRSEALSGAVLAAGILLLIMSAYPDRVSKITLPGGNEIALGAATDSAQAVATRLIREAPDELQRDPEQFGAALAQALEEVLRQSDAASQTARSLQPSDEELSAAVKSALHGLAATPDAED